MAVSADPHMRMDVPLGHDAGTQWVTEALGQAMMVMADGDHSARLAAVIDTVVPIVPLS